MTTTEDEALEALLRDTFAGARARGGLDTQAVTAGIAARTTTLRRRRAAARGAALTAGIAATVLAVAIGSGTFGPARTVLSVSTHTGSTDARWSSLVGSSEGFAYRFPTTVATPWPAGLEGQTQPDDTNASGSDVATDASPLSHEDADLVGPAGVCTWDVRTDRRQPVAGRSWDLTFSSSPGRGGAHLGLAGFTTGTGADALRDLRADALACGPGPDLKAVTWAGHAQDSVLFVGTSTVADTTFTQAMAVTRVGDVLVSGAAISGDPALARRAATELADSAVGHLRQLDFPPGLGQPLGRSTVAPNAASAPGASPAAPLVAAEEYRFGDVLPTVAELGHGLRYHGDAIHGRTVPASSGQLCDLSGLPAARVAQANAAPHPVAGTLQSAWSGDGQGPDPSVDINVTGYSAGTGPEAFRRLQQDTGPCTWLPAQERQAWPGEDDQQTWLSRGAGADSATYIAARRLGDVIVSVQVVGFSAQDAHDEAVRVNGIIAQKLRDSGLPAARGR
ncbi:hypothetical protein [Phycicoccus sp. Root101]|uniref:hypothetical protein n=1 Tax=Phycicoccus sp. Root101 TaxID=1736421 RepID=UPI000703C01A|nr:hypothetical protein [Phycicoccus sp. Root101]KQU70680.1 hypothetical protein ASC58_02500 [Phycicoccus sp. Root101]